MTMKIEVQVFWFVMLCSVVVRIPAFQRSMLPPSSGWLVSQPRRCWLETVFNSFLGHWNNWI